MRMEQMTYLNLWYDVGVSGQLHYSALVGPGEQPLSSYIAGTLGHM